MTDSKLYCQNCGRSAWVEINVGDVPFTMVGDDDEFIERSRPKTRICAHCGGDMGDTPPYMPDPPYSATLREVGKRAAEVVISVGSTPVALYHVHFLNALNQWKKDMYGLLPDRVFEPQLDHFLDEISKIAVTTLEVNSIFILRHADKARQLVRDNPDPRIIDEYLLSVRQSYLLG